MISLIGKSPARGASASGAARPYRDAPPTRHDLPPRDTWKETARRSRHYKPSGSRIPTNQAAAALPLVRSELAANPLVSWVSPHGTKAVLALNIRGSKVRIVVIDYPVRAVTLSPSETKYLRPLAGQRPPRAVLRQFRRYGKSNGITQAARRTLARIAAILTAKQEQ